MAVTATCLEKLARYMVNAPADLSITEAVARPTGFLDLCREGSAPIDVVEPHHSVHCAAKAARASALRFGMVELGARCEGRSRKSRRGWMNVTACRACGQADWPLAARQKYRDFFRGCR
jgi:hypothetical protein